MTQKNISTESISTNEQRSSTISNEMHEKIREQLQINAAQHALYSLIVILDEERQGADSFRIVERLKSIFEGLARTHPQVEKDLEELLKETRKSNDD